jgi:hypothetical protein
MTKKIEPVVEITEEATPVVEETNLETAITVDETVVDETISLVDKMKPYSDAVNNILTPLGEAVQFKESLDKGLITVGTKISYVVSGAEEPTEVIVDDAFLSLPIQNLEYYEKFNYKIV